MRISSCSRSSASMAAEWGGRFAQVRSGGWGRRSEARASIVSALPFVPPTSVIGICNACLTIVKTPKPLPRRGSSHRDCPNRLRCLSAVSGSPVFDGWSRHALCGRFGYSDLKEASVRGPMYFVSDSGDSDGGLGWRYGSGESIAADRKSTRLNSSHLGISYAVFCLKKKKKKKKD